MNVAVFSDRGMADVPIVRTGERLSYNILDVVVGKVG